MSINFRGANHQSTDYTRLLEKRAEISRRMEVLEASPISIQYKETISLLDKERMEIHRKLEELGREKGLTSIEVQMDILSTQFNYQDLGIVGLTAMPVVYKDGENKKRRSQKGILLIYNQSFTNLGWEGQGVKIGYSLEFSALLKEYGRKLLDFIHRNGFSDTKIIEEEIDESGAAHVSHAFYEGIFVPDEISESVISWLRFHKEIWISEKDFREKQESYWSYKSFENEPFRFPKNILGKEREKLEELCERFQATRSHLDHRIGRIKMSEKQKKQYELIEDTFNDQELITLECNFSRKETLLSLFDSERVFISEQRISDFFNSFETIIQEREQRMREIKNEFIREGAEDDAEARTKDIEAHYQKVDKRESKLRR